MFRNIKEDFRTYQKDFGAQGFWAMLVYRFGRWRYGVRPALLQKLFALIFYKVLHKFGGVIVSGYTRFGDNCRIRNGVVVGLKNVEDPGAPVIGNNVDIGTGAKVLGKIRIGNNVLIGANAVVIADVPDNSIAVGVPAVVKARNHDQVSTV